MQVEARAGTQVVTDGQQSPLRSGRSGELITADAHARYQEAVLRGNVFFATTQNTAFTSSVGITITTIVGLVVSNPPGSGKCLVLLQAEFTPSGVVAGAMAISVIPFNATALTHTTALTIRNALVSGGNSSIAFADQGATALSTPIPSKFLFACLSTNTAQPAGPVLYDLGGSIILPQGCGAAILGTAAITGWASLLWEEIVAPG